MWTFSNHTVAAARVAFTLIAYNAAQIAKTKVGKRLAARGIRKLRRKMRIRFGSVPIIVFAGDAYAVLHIEELVTLLGGAPPRFPFLPGSERLPPFSLS